MLSQKFKDTFLRMNYVVNEMGPVYLLFRTDDNHGFHKSPANTNNSEIGRMNSCCSVAPFDIIRSPFMTW